MTEIMLIKIIKCWNGSIFLNNSDKKSKRPASEFWICLQFNDSPFEFEMGIDDEIIGLNSTLLQSIS